MDDVGCVHVCTAALSTQKDAFAKVNLQDCETD